MTTSNGFKDIEFGGPATYRIVVQGVLREDWSDRLGGMAISTTTREAGAPHTVLQGRIQDQAQLSGVMDALYGLHLPIVSVERIGGEE